VRDREREREKERERERERESVRELVGDEERNVRKKLVFTS
jgi:hypothetical protein